MLPFDKVPALNGKLHTVISRQETEASCTDAAQSVARVLSPEAVDTLITDAPESGGGLLDGREGLLQQDRHIDGYGRIPTGRVRGTGLLDWTRAMNQFKTRFGNWLSLRPTSTDRNHRRNLTKRKELTSHTNRLTSPRCVNRPGSYRLDIQGRRSARHHPGGGSQLGATGRG
ncbi:FIC domain-containing protein [Streptomyces sp. NBRC 110611]|nr:FIC domain-containing protein [Streptomyces sp. NBRC 110611]